MTGPNRRGYDLVSTEALDGNPEIPGWVSDQAIRNVCAIVDSAGEARELIDALGLQVAGRESSIRMLGRIRPLGAYPNTGARTPTVCKGTCGNRLRPTRARVADWPETVQHQGRGLCRRCYRAAKEAVA